MSENNGKDLQKIAELYFKLFKTCLKNPPKDEKYTNIFWRSALNTIYQYETFTGDKKTLLGLKKDIDELEKKYIFKK